MREQERRRLEAAGRGPMRSPGRPPVARREERQGFWAAIARGLSSEDAAVEVGVSPVVGTRWFREARRHAADHAGPALSGRYLSFAEREEIALLRRAGRRGARDRPSAGPVAVDDLARAAAQRRHSGWQARVPGHERPVARRPAGAAPEDREAGRQRAVAQLRAGAAGRCGQASRRTRCPARTSRGSAVGMGGVRTAVGPRRGVRSRSRTACGSTSPMMSPCGSRTKRSIRRSTSRVAARCGEN